MEQIFPEWAEAQKVIELIKGIQGVRVQSQNANNTASHIQTTYIVLKEVESFIIVQHHRIRNIERSIKEQEDAVNQAYEAFEARIVAQGRRVDQITPTMNWEVDTEMDSEGKWFDAEYLSATRGAKVAMSLLQQKADLEQYLATSLRSNMKSLLQSGVLDELEELHWDRSIDLIAFGVEEVEKMTIKESKSKERDQVEQTNEESSWEIGRAVAAQPADNERQLIPFSPNKHMPAATTKAPVLQHQQEQTPSESPEKNDEVKPEPCSLCGWMNHTTKGCWKVRTGQVILEAKRKANSSSSTSEVNHIKAVAGPRNVCGYCSKPGHQVTSCYAQYPHLRPGYVEGGRRNSNWAKPVGKRNAHVDYYVDERTQGEKDRARRKAGWKETNVRMARGPYDSNDEKGSWDGVY